MMATDDDRGAAPPQDELQFDRAEYAAAPAATAVACAACARPIDETYYEAGGKVLCGGCRDAVLAHFTGGSRPGRFLRAALFGGAAALAGSGLYYLVWTLTGRHWGLIAIVVGAMVGTAVRNGSRHRGGLAYQALAIFLTYTAIVSSYVPVLAVALHKHGIELVKMVDVATITALYGLPILSGARSIIGLVIIFFGLQQAWRLNRAARPTITGPFLVGGAGEGEGPQGAPAHA